MSEVQITAWYDEEQNSISIRPGNDPDMRTYIGAWYPNEDEVKGVVVPRITPMQPGLPLPSVVASMVSIDDVVTLKGAGFSADEIIRLLESGGLRSSNDT